MALKIRLRKQGRLNRPFYRLVLTDAQAPRDGKYLESLGWYNPIEVEDEKKISVDANRIQHWLSFGAQMTESASHLIKKISPEVVSGHVQREVERRAKKAAKRKSGKEAGKK